MIQAIVLFVITFLIVLVAAANVPEAQVQDVHVQDAYPAIAFFAGVVVAVLGFLLKFFMTRDRGAIDAKFDEMRQERIREIDLLHKHQEHMESKMKDWVDGVGIKLDRVAEVIDKKVAEEVDELRRHDADLYNKFNEINHRLGRLIGEHDTLKDAHHRRHNGP